jgi:hypothetical protein
MEWINESSLGNKTGMFFVSFIEGSDKGWSEQLDIDILQRSLFINARRLDNHIQNINRRRRLVLFGGMNLNESLGFTPNEK